MGKLCQSLSRWTESGVGNLSAIEVEDGEVAEVLEMRQPGVGNPSAVELERGEFGQPPRCANPASEIRVSSRRRSSSFVRLFEMHQPGIGDRSVDEAEDGEVFQPLQMR